MQDFLSKRRIDTLAYYVIEKKQNFTICTLFYTSAKKSVVYCLSYSQFKLQDITFLQTKVVPVLFLTNRLKVVSVVLSSFIRIQ